nr:phosphatase PAP2 family protein [Kribbella shirazensis]
MLKRFTWAHLLAIASTVAFLVLAVLVTADATGRIDTQLRQVFRPDDVWGIWQLIFGNVVDGLMPAVALALLGAAGLFAAIRRRSWRPVRYVGVLGAIAVLLTVISKAVIQRTDPHGGTSSLGGAFPSGHMVVLLVSLGGALLVLSEHPPLWAWLLVVVIELTMGLSLLLLSMHWFTDVISGGLLAAPVVVLARSPRFLGPVHRTGQPTAVDPVGSTP